MISFFVTLRRDIDVRLRRTFPVPLWLFGRERALLGRFISASLGRAALAAISILLIRDFLGGALGRQTGGAGWIAGEPGSAAALWSLAALLFLTTLGMTALAYAARMTQHRLVTAIELDIMERLIRTLLRLSAGFFERRSRGDLIHALQRDVANLRTMLLSASTLLIDALHAIALIVAAVIVSPALAVWAFLLLPLAAAPIAFFARRTIVRSHGLRRKGVALFDLFLQMLSGLGVIRIYHGEESEAERAVGRTRRYLDELTAMEQARAAARVVFDALAGLGLIAVIIVGGFQVLRGALGWPELLAFLMALRAAHTPLHGLNSNLLEVQRQHASVAHINSILHERPDVADAPGATAVASPPERLAVRQLGFSRGGHRILDDVSFAVRAGETLGIVGPSGAGKTTLLNLIARFYDPDSGAVLYDERDVRTFTLRSVHQCLALVTQEPFLFSTTIRENIRCGRPGASDTDVEAAAGAAEIHADIIRMPDGYETVVGHGGRSLSRGEAQRINIARAILKNAPVLLLDEATSSLDSHAEAQVQHAIDRLVAGRLTVCVAHRLSTLRDATRILVLEKGRVAGFGPHSDLLINCPTYRRLWEAQSSVSVPARAV